MAGQTKLLIDRIIQLRTGGNAALVGLVRAHLIVQGVHPDRYDPQSEDDPEIVAKLERMLADFGGAPSARA